MSNSPLYWAGVILFGLLCIGYFWYTRHATVQHILNGKIEINASEADALEALLQAASITPSGVRVVDAERDKPCWHASWHPVDRWLRVDRRFGRYGENCVGIYGDAIVSLSLVSHRLEGISQLSAFSELRTVQLRGGRISSLHGMPATCRWRELILQDNNLAGFHELKPCPDLENLDLSFNEITDISGLSSLSNLSRLRIDNNKLQRIEGLSSHPALEQLFLTNNKLTSVEGFEGMQWLGTLDISGNAISTLAPLKNLPALRSLHAGSNPVTAIESAVFDELPVLQFVGLGRTAVDLLPARYVYSGEGEWSVKVVEKTRRMPEIDVTNTPLAEQLMAEAVSNFDNSVVIPVAELPRGRGRAYQSKKSGRSGGLLSQGVDYEGSIAGLDGTYSAGFDGLNRSVGVTVNASVEKGKVRVYLADSRGGYYYKEAIPGHPLEISGMLITGTSTYLVYFESVGRKAEGIKWIVE